MISVKKFKVEYNNLKLLESLSIENGRVSTKLPWSTINTDSNYGEEVFRFLDTDGIDVDIFWYNEESFDSFLGGTKPFEILDIGEDRNGDITVVVIGKKTHRILTKWTRRIENILHRTVFLEWLGGDYDLHNVC
jgi:hypothetical protein